MTHRIRSLLPSIGLGLLLLLSASLAEAGGTAMAVRKTVENSMLVTGTIDIAPDGTTAAHSLDQPEKLPEFVRDLAAKATKGFRFEPVLVDGKPVRARAKMGLRVVATKQDNGDYRMRIASASFGDETKVKGEDVTSSPAMMAPPAYPMSAVASGITGTVYVIVKVDRTGAVQQAAVEQTNLTVVGNGRVMEQGRAILEKSSLVAARKWRFDVPVKGEQATQPFWSVRVPVDYQLHESGSRDSSKEELATPYGKWRAYVPGPRNRIPWISEDENRVSPDALVSGAPHTVGRGPKLLTPLKG